MTENTPAVYAQNYRAAQYDGKVAEKRRREALNALQEAQRSGDYHAIITCLGEYTVAVHAGLSALLVIHAAFVSGVEVRCIVGATREAEPAPAVVKTCAKCGTDKTLNKRGQMICRPCSRAIAAHGCAAAAAVKIARREAAEAAMTVPAPVSQKPTVAEVYGAVSETHGIGASIPRMSPNAGRLKAGECLYPRREVTV